MPSYTQKAESQISKLTELVGEMIEIVCNQHKVRPAIALDIAEKATRIAQNIQRIEAFEAEREQLKAQREGGGGPVVNVRIIRDTAGNGGDDGTE